MLNEKSNILKNKRIAKTLALALLITIAVQVVAIQLTAAQTIPKGMNWDLSQSPSSTRLLLWERYKDHIPTQVFMVMSPNPVGVGQTVSFVLFMPQQPNAASSTNDIRYKYTVDVTGPDSAKKTIGPIESDSTGTAYTLYTPEQVGNYTVTVNFLPLLYKWSSSANERNYYGVTYDGASYTKTLTVQEEPIYPTGWTDVPLPSEYWSRPIEGTNTGWWEVASNWLGGPKDRDNGGVDNQYQQDGIAPDSGHIIWTKPTEDGGLVGGGNFSVPGEVFNAGHQYQTRFTNPIIMWGRLYYEIPIQWQGGGGGWVSVDLRTGETIWQNMSMGVGDVPAPEFGYYYDLDNMNNHGVVTPGWLFSENFEHSIHPRYGIIDRLQLVNAPAPVRSSQQVLPTTVFDVIGPKGESIRYELNLNGWLAQWNSSRVFDDSESGKVPANCPITPARPANSYWNGSMWVSNTVRQQQGYASVTSPAYDWNVTIPWIKGMTGGSETIRGAILNDILVGTNGSHPVGTSAPRFDYPSPVTMWAINLKPGSVGQLLYMKNIDTIPNPPDGGEMMLERVAEGVAVFVKLFERSWIGYDIYTGNKLWETIPEADFNPFGYYSFPSLIHTESITIAEGKLFTGGYTGAVHCYDLKTGELLWRYEDYTGRTVFPYFTLMLGPVADGKIFIGTHEHSADTPLFKGNKVRAIDLETGSEVWSMYGWAHPYTFAVADGTLIYWNNYDHQVYAVAKGPTAMTVEAPTFAAKMGDSIIIRGTVNDISPGTKQHEQSLRFPTGVPAVSDESQSKWMEYVYMQKARPTNATGVPVTLSVVDANGNYREIGNTTTNDGFFTFNWKPDIEGQYTVYASFAGSNSYWPSHAVTSFAVDPAAPTQGPQPTTAPLTVEQYFIPAITAIAVLIVACFAISILVLRKRP